MPTPICPIHNVEMVLKTARRGRNVGGRFWGCPNWTREKGCPTFPFEEDSNIAPEGIPAPTHSLQSVLARPFSARARLQGFHVRFFESVAIPENVLENIIDGNLPENYLRAFSQWRMDYPLPQKSLDWTERERQIFSIAEKILTRGRLTRCSPILEREYKDKFLGNDAHIESLQLSNLLNNNLQYENFEFWFDSLAEKKFYLNFLLNKFGLHFHRWIVPQVDITSLLSSNFENSISGRIDFLICHPDLNPIIVEIDGQAHQQHQDEDAARDAALTEEGYCVFRIPASEIECLEGIQLSSLERLLTIDSGITDSHNEMLNKFIHAYRMSHQIQLTVLQAIQAGFLPLSEASNWNLTTDLEHIGLFDQRDSLFVFSSAINDLLSLLRHIGDLYAVPICKGEPKLSTSPENGSLAISFAGQAQTSPVTFFIQDISVPFHIANSVVATKPAILDKPPLNILEYFLNYIFRKPSFWEGQVDAITRTLQGKDSIVLLPTGAGKSISFQLASLLLPGRAIVIDPIISLMEDQIDNLQTVGIDRAVAITSQITNPQDRSQILSLFGQGEYLFAYIAPERFQTIEFRNALRSLTVHTPISLIAVDEAHCVSEWGHDFRTAYLNIGRTSRTYCESNDVAPPLLALTGTASRAVLKDVQRELQIEDFDAIITPRTFDRPELIFHVVRSSSAEKSARLLGYLGQTLPSNFSIPPASFFQPDGKSTYAGLVFCPHVNGNFGVVEISDIIKSKLAVPTAYYSGSAPKFQARGEWGFTRQAVAHQFKHNQVPLLVCTKAFGMGIDKPNIRFTVHFGIPSSIESFYQEAGRAGRDRQIAHCCILVSDDDPQRTQKLLDPNTKAEQVHQIIQAISRNENDDVTRALYFQTNAFPGIAIEKSRAAQALQAFPDILKKGERTVVFQGLERLQAEKSLHRLLILGIISDYTISYNSGEFVVQVTGTAKDSIIEAYGKYVGGYLGGRRQAEIDKANKLISLPASQFVLEMVDLLLHFIYEVIERGRRRALYEMLLAATVSPTDTSIRQRILRYLEATQYSEVLEQILAKNNAGLEETQEAFEAVRSPNDAAELRGQVSRYLESYPDHPGLLMLRALSEIFCRDQNSEITKQNFLASVSYAEENYSVSGQPLFDFIVWAITKISERDISLAQDIQENVLNRYPDRLLARSFVTNSPVILATVPAWFLLSILADKSKKIISA